MLTRNVHFPRPVLATRDKGAQTHSRLGVGAVGCRVSCSRFRGIVACVGDVGDSELSSTARLCGSGVKVAYLGDRAAQQVDVQIKPLHLGLLSTQLHILILVPVAVCQAFRTTCRHVRNPEPTCPYESSQSSRS